MKYLIAFLFVTINFSCAALKKKTEEKPVMVEQVVEEVVEEEPKKVLDHLTEDMEPQGNCREDWSKKERLVLYKNDARIQRMIDGGDGVIYVTTMVAKEGYVSFAKVDKLKTTVENQKILNMALEIVQEYEFEPSETAPKNDCGFVKFNLNTM